VKLPIKFSNPVLHGPSGYKVFAVAVAIKRGRCQRIVLFQRLVNAWRRIPELTETRPVQPQVFPIFGFDEFIRYSLRYFRVTAAFIDILRTVTSRFCASANGVVERQHDGHLTELYPFKNGPLSVPASRQPLNSPRHAIEKHVRNSEDRPEAPERFIFRLRRSYQSDRLVSHQFVNELQEARVTFLKVIVPPLFRYRCVLLFWGVLFFHIACWDCFSNHGFPASNNLGFRARASFGLFFEAAMIVRVAFITLARIGSRFNCAYGCVEARLL
jgi:hypothetical protein